ncbi:hypothetical protein DFP72DRAFT_1082785 [Ephemerocybe angulata]|uniref:Uncharacterized protein n=1 Tax=Ephemerocybe angulata TaxID=980116 RepID=A0A8H6H7N9_9AGAR|nr:hypothetical protein DFP72DRAFT_1082785 [Tulosesus angulatus]
MAPPSTFRSQLSVQRESNKRTRNGSRTGPLLGARLEAVGRLDGTRVFRPSLLSLALVVAECLRLTSYPDNPIRPSFGEDGLTSTSFSSQPIDESA